MGRQLPLVTARDFSRSATFNGQSKGWLYPRPEAINSIRTQLESDRIAEFVGQTNVSFAQRSVAERDNVVHNLNSGFTVNVKAPRPWEATNAPGGVQTASGCELISTYVADSQCLVFSSGATSVWRFADGADLLRFLKASPPFEFYVCDDLATYMLCYNDHDFIIGWGKATEWVEQLPAD